MSRRHRLQVHLRHQGVRRRRQGTVGDGQGRSAVRISRSKSGLEMERPPGATRRPRAPGSHGPVARCYGSRLELSVFQTPAAPGQFTQSHCASLMRALRLRQWAPKCISLSRAMLRSLSWSGARTVFPATLMVQSVTLSGLWEGTNSLVLSCPIVIFDLCT